MTKSLIRLAMFLASVASITACGSSPAAPSALSRAVVTITAVSATAERIPTGTRYHLQYAVRETSGLGVTLILLRHTFPSGVVAETDTRNLTGGARTPRVAPGTTLPVTYDITVEPSPPESPVTITVTFTDDEGRSGSASPVTVPVAVLGTS
jgi:hypothetical protein